MLQDKLNKEILLFDGAMGTQLQNAGLKGGEVPEYYNIDHPDLLIDIHSRYLKAGADFITTNTFGANPLKLEQSKYNYQEVILKAVENAKIARDRVNPDAYIAFDIGPVGQLMEPMGTLTFDQVYQSIKEIDRCFFLLTHFFVNHIIKLDTEHFCYQNILSAHHWRLINDWLENIVRLPEASNKCPA